MAIVHIVTADQPNNRTDVSEGLEANFKKRDYAVLRRTNEEVAYHTAGSGIEGADYITPPDIVIIDARGDMDAAVRSASHYSPLVSRIIMLTSPTASPVYQSRCATDGKATPIGITGNSPVTIDFVAATAVNMLAIGGADKSAGSTNDQDKIAFDGGWLDTKRLVLSGPDGRSSLTPEQTHTLAALLVNPNKPMSKKLLFSIAECGEDAELKIMDVIICRIRKALTDVGLNGGIDKADMIGTIWGGDIVYNPGAALSPPIRPSTGQKVKGITFAPGEAVSTTAAA